MVNVGQSGRTTIMTNTGVASPEVEDSFLTVSHAVTSVALHKKGIREKRGKGMRRKVSPSTLIPKNWYSFLRIDQNKMELFHLLLEPMIHADDDTLENGKLTYPRYTL